MPRVSVLIPVYNCERYVAETIESVLAQTMGDFELILVDDGSRDGSRRVIEPFAQRDARVKLIARDNGGMARALNDGIAAVTAPLVARLDADDLATPDRLAVQCAFLDERPDVVCVGCNADLIDRDGRPIGYFDVPQTHEQIESELLKGHSAIHHPAAMIRTDALRRIGGYREIEGSNLIGDYDLWLRLGEVGRLANMPQRLLVKRQLETGIVCTTLEHRRELSQGVLNEAWRRRGLPGDPPRVPPDRLTRLADVYRQWAWMALSLGETAVARRYALRSWWRRPLLGDSWRLLLCAARGR